MRMRRFRSFAFFVLPVVALLAVGCQALPIQVGLQDVAVDLGVTTNTQGYVLYPASPSAFQKPDLHVSSVTVDGDVRASGLSGDTGFTFYGRATDPSTDPSCSSFTKLSGTYFACPASGEASVSGVVTVPANGASVPVHFRGAVLAKAANAGRLWVGAAVQGGVSTNAVLHFSHLVASVTLL